MNVYYEPRQKYWICEAEMYGRKYIGEGRTATEAEAYGFQWQCDVLDAIEKEMHNELRKCDQQENDRGLGGCPSNSNSSEERRNGIEEGDMQ